MKKTGLWMAALLVAAALAAGCGDKDRPQETEGQDTQARNSAALETDAGLPDGGEETESLPQELSGTEAWLEVNTYGPQQLVQVNGELYYNTGETNNVARCGNLDGNITSVTAAGETPAEDGQANFEADGWQRGMEEDTIEINIDGDWYVFRKM